MRAPVMVVTARLRVRIEKMHFGHNTAGNSPPVGRYCNPRSVPRSISSSIGHLPLPVENNPLPTTHPLPFRLKRIRVFNLERQTHPSPRLAFRFASQLAEDMLDDAKSVAGLCRLCIQRGLEDDPVDTPALGHLYRRLLVAASTRVSRLFRSTKRFGSERIPKATVLSRPPRGRRWGLRCLVEASISEHTTPGEVFAATAVGSLVADGAESRSVPREIDERRGAATEQLRVAPAFFEGEIQRQERRPVSN